MIEYAVQPGTLCQVHVPGHHGGALDAVNSKLGIARRMEARRCRQDLRHRSLTIVENANETHIYNEHKYNR